MELINKIITKLNVIYYTTKRPTIERNVNDIKDDISELKRIVEETNNAITNVSGYEEELLDIINEQKFEINELKEEKAELIDTIKALENENIGLKSRLTNVERRKKKKKRRETKHKHKKRHITESRDEVIELYDEIVDSNNKITILSKSNEELKDHINDKKFEINELTSEYNILMSKHSLLAIQSIVPKFISKTSKNRKFANLHLDATKSVPLSQLEDHDKVWKFLLAECFECHDTLTNNFIEDKFILSDDKKIIRSYPNHEYILTNDNVKFVLITSIPQLINLIIDLKREDKTIVFNLIEFKEYLRNHVKNYSNNQTTIACILGILYLINLSEEELELLLLKAKDINMTYLETIDNNGVVTEIRYYMYIITLNDTIIKIELNKDFEYKFKINIIDVNRYTRGFSDTLLNYIKDNKENIQTLLIDKIKHFTSTDNHECFEHVIIDENNRDVNRQKIVKSLKRKNYITTTGPRNKVSVDLEIKTDFNYNKFINQNNLLEFTKRLQQQNDMYVTNNKQLISRKLRFTSNDKEDLSKQNYGDVNNRYFKHTISHIVDNFDEDTIINVDFNEFNYMVEPDMLIISYI